MWHFFESSKIKTKNKNKNKTILFHLIGNPKIVFKTPSIELINVIYFN